MTESFPKSESRGRTAAAKLCKATLDVSLLAVIARAFARSKSTTSKPFRRYRVRIAKQSPLIANSRQDTNKSRSETDFMNSHTRPHNPDGTLEVYEYEYPLYHGWNAAIRSFCCWQ